MIFQPASECRCCGGSDLVRILDLGSQPLANSYHRGQSLPAYPLEVNACRDCNHSQLSGVVAPEAMFKNYLYVSGTTSTLRAHFDGLVAEVLAIAPARPLRVLDIACNDGTLLECFRARGCDVVGVDPAENLRRITAAKNLTVHVGYWDESLARRVGAVDVITATNVLAHVADPKGFLTACSTCLRAGGTIAIELPYARQLLESNAYDTIYHEHLSYFLACSMATLLGRAEWGVRKCSQVAIHGGSLRLLLQSRSAHDQLFTELCEAEDRDGITSLDALQAFASRVVASRTELLQLTRALAERRQRVVGYGASAKGNTMLNFCQLDLEYIVDDNPLKWGYLTPGRDIPIRDSDCLTLDPDPLHILLLAWNFRQEVLRKIVRLRGRRGDHAISYIPRVSHESLDAHLAFLE